MWFVLPVMAGWNHSTLNVNLFNIHVNLFHMGRGEEIVMSRSPGNPERPWSTALAAGFASAPALTVLGFVMAADLVFCHASVWLWTGG